MTPKKLERPAGLECMVGEQIQTRWIDILYLDATQEA